MPEPTHDFSPTDLRCEHRLETLGLGTSRPRLSWLTQSQSQGWQQSAYELELLDPDTAHRESSGKLESQESVLVPWPFAPLESRQRRAVRVRVWDASGRISDWSAALQLEVGLLRPEDWAAHLITPDWDEDTSQPQPCPILRREFELRPAIKQARLYVTALGVYEISLNGQRLGDMVLAPGWSSYDHRLRYQSFDATNLLLEGKNTIGALLGDGWYRGRLGFGGGRRNIYGQRLALLAQLEIEYQDGTRERIVSDTSWRASTGPVLSSDLYDGETYDARLEQPGWNCAGFDDQSWAEVRTLEYDPSKLEAPLGPPVRRIEERSPEAILQSPSGKTLVDFGQNLVGWLRLSVRGEAGHTIRLRHAEVLEHGELGTRPLRHAAATDQYTLRGQGLESFEPHFTFHGFRYAEIENWPGELTPEHLRAVVVHSDLERTGWFECSEPLLNQLHQNIIWSMRGNFLDIPTDCPQRDERLGWTGDIQVFAPTASFLYDCAGFLESWLRDLKAEQTQTGSVPFTIPNVLGEGGTTPMTAWGDAAVIVPWVLYQRYGDTGIFEAQFASMCGWVDHLCQLTGPGCLWETGPQFGDWLDPNAPPENPGAARTPAAVVATAYFARSAELVGQAARLLGKPAEATRYLELAAKVRQAFVNEYVTPNGRVLGDAITAYALALEFNLISDPESRRHAGAQLIQLVRNNGYRIATGFVGTPLICDALCHANAPEAAFRLLLQRQCPSWLYPVTMGATTIWERWDSMLPDGSINPGEMTSFNHYALGAVADWMQRSLAGLAPAAPGYRQLEIKPILGGGLTSASANHRTPYGLAEVGWTLKTGTFTLQILVPANTTARVTLPGQATPLEVGSGQHRWTYPYTVPSTPRAALNLDITEGELLDHPSAYAQVLETVRAHNPSAITNDNRLRNTGSITLRQMSFMMPGGKELQAKLEAVLEACARET